MRQIKIILAIFLVIALFAGCGGGSTTGTVTGTLSLANTTGMIHTTNLIQPKSIFTFPTVAVHRTGYSQLSVSGEKIIKFRSNLSETEISQIIPQFGGAIKRKVYGADNIYVIQTDPQKFTLTAVSQNPNIVYIEDNMIFSVFDVPNDTYYSEYQTWNYGMLNLPNAWHIQKGNSNVIVAVVDTGVALNHPDLAANLVSGWDIINNNASPSDTQYVNADNQYSHGTHVAGIISADTNDGMGVAGVAWNVKIMPVRVMGSDGYGTLDNITSGINWAVAHGANIINLSLGIEETLSEAPQTLKDALQNALNQNVTVVAAAGNNSGGYVSFPASYPGVIAVSAVDSSGNITSYSNSGPEIWVCAPGGDGLSQTNPSSWVLSTSYDKLNRINDYIGMAGTSMACPHISGLAALLYSHGVTTPNDIKNHLKMSSTHSDQYGYGLPDAYTIISGSPIGVTAAKVFYALNNGTVGAFTDPKVNGNYTVSNIPTGTVYICAFIDTNGDGQVRTGDKFAYISENITAGVNLTQQNLALQTVTVSTPKSISAYIQAGFQ